MIIDFLKMELQPMNEKRVIFMEDHIPIRPDRILLFGRQTFKWSLWDVIFHENNSRSCFCVNCMNYLCKNPNAMLRCVLIFLVILYPSPESTLSLGL